MLVTTLGATEGPTLVTYYYTEIGSLEGFNDGTAYDKFDGWLLVARLGLVYILKLRIDEVTEQCFWFEKLIGATLGSITTWCI